MKKPVFLSDNKDESSSAISMDFEHKLYQKCRKLNITMFTISQRESLYEFHNYVLKFDGDGNWTYEKIIHDQEYDYRQI
jgi:ATP-binding cassette subfamily D (ALD) protein 3